MQDLPEILTMEQAAGLLQVSVRTIQRMVKDRKIPARQIGSQWRFDRDQLRQWVRCEVDVPEPPKSQQDLIDHESARFGLDRPETLMDLQRAAARRLEQQTADAKDED